MFELLVGLQVIDDEQYRLYREAMTPLLHGCGGSFGYDFKIAEVLINESGAPMNRVFTIRFPDKTTSEAFFNDPTIFGPRNSSSPSLSRYAGP